MIMMINVFSLILYVLFIVWFTYVNHKMFKASRSQMKIIHRQDLFIRRLIEACAKHCPKEEIMDIIEDCNKYDK